MRSRPLSRVATAAANGASMGALVSFSMECNVLRTAFEMKNNATAFVHGVASGIGVSGSGGGISKRALGFLIVDANCNESDIDALDAAQLASHRGIVSVVTRRSIGTGHERDGVLVVGLCCGTRLYPWSVLSAGACPPHVLDESTTAIRLHSLNPPLYCLSLPPPPNVAAAASVYLYGGGDHATESMCRNRMQNGVRVEWLLSIVANEFMRLFGLMAIRQQCVGWTCRRIGAYEDNLLAQYLFVPLLIRVVTTSADVADRVDEVVQAFGRWTQSLLSYLDGRLSLSDIRDRVANAKTRFARAIERERMIADVFGGTSQSSSSTSSSSPPPLMAHVIATATKTLWRQMQPYQTAFATPSLPPAPENCASH